jgi:hypothetical protein
MTSLADLAAAIAETLAPGVTGALADPRPAAPATAEPARAQTPIGDPDEDEGYDDEDEEDDEEDEEDEEPPMQLGRRPPPSSRG